MVQPIDQKVAIVTGAGRGIGRAIALELARAGFALALAARSSEELVETRTLTGLAPNRSLIVLLDLASEDAPDNLISATLEHFGRLDVLINNAGWAPPRTPLIKTTATDQDRIIAVNLRAPIALARLAAAHMTQQENGGTIVNVASMAARNTPPGEAIYAAAKAGIVAFTRSCASEFQRQNVRISVVIPGLTDTTLIPENKRLNRSLMLAPKDIAATVMSIVEAAPGVAPIETVLEPARDPMRSGR
jgi:NAD(P)-dependent dehydrogenase (short-subunit alcohol dehydrogenase family)